MVAQTASGFGSSWIACVCQPWPCARRQSAGRTRRQTARRTRRMVTHAHRPRRFRRSGRRIRRVLSPSRRHQSRRAAHLCRSAPVARSRPPLPSRPQRRPRRQTCAHYPMQSSGLTGSRPPNACAHIRANVSHCIVSCCAMLGAAADMVCHRTCDGATDNIARRNDDSCGQLERH